MTQLVELVRSRLLAVLLASQGEHYAVTMRRLTEELRQLDRGLPNLHVIDMTHSDFPDQYFLDTAHLNQRGAKLFSVRLREELKRLRLIENSSPV